MGNINVIVNRVTLNGTEKIVERDVSVKGSRLMGQFDEDKKGTKRSIWGIIKLKMDLV